jgi:hypothetical protein
MSRIRFDHVPGQSAPGHVVMPFALPGWVALFFVTVNQVLVRLWTRVIGVDPWFSNHGLARVPSFGRLV